MSLFDFLILLNMKRLRARVLSLNGTLTVASEQRKTRDIDLIKMVLTEVMVYRILTSTYPLVFLYTTITANITNKSATRLQVESFISFISNAFLQYLNSGSCFFICMATSRTFRSEVKKLILSRGRDNNSGVIIRTTQRELITRKQTQRTLPK